MRGEEEREERQDGRTRKKTWWFCPQFQNKVPLFQKTQPGEKPMFLRSLL